MLAGNPKETIKNLINNEISFNKISEQKEISLETPNSSEDISNNNLDGAIYLDTIFNAFHILTERLGSSGEINLSALNKTTCDLLNISTASKIYKQFGFSTFKKAINHAKSEFGQKIEISGSFLKY